MLLDRFILPCKQGTHECVPCTLPLLFFFSFPFLLQNVATCLEKDDHIDDDDGGSNFCTSWVKSNLMLQVQKKIHTGSQKQTISTNPITLRWNVYVCILSTNAWKRSASRCVCPIYTRTRNKNLRTNFCERHDHKSKSCFAASWIHKRWR